MSLLSKQFQNQLLAGPVNRSSRENKEEHIDKTVSAFDQNTPAGAQFPPLIAAFKTAGAAFKAQKQDTSTNMQQAASQTVKEVKVDFRSTATFLDKKIKADFENQPSVYLEFFPKSLTAIKESKKGDIAGVIENWLVRATARQAIMGAALVTRLTALKASWMAAISDQGGNVSKVKTARILIDPAWAAVAWAEFALVLALINLDPQNPQLLDAYFDMSMFGYAKDADTDGKASLTGSVKHSISGLFIAQALLTFTHMGTGKVFQFKTNSEGLFTKHKLPLGLFDFTVSANGYLSFTGQANLADTTNTPLDVTLLQLGES